MKLRFYQEEAVAALLDALENDRDACPVIGMPTGSGKSPVLANFCMRILKAHSKTRIVVATHAKELVAQNAATMARIWPEAPYGVFSAGLGVKQHQMPITFCGIQSAAKVPHLFGRVHILIIDEAHAVGPDDESNYQQFIAGLKLMNPNLRVAGLTATPFRKKNGMITDGPTFNKMCYDITGRIAFVKLVEMGYLSPLTAKPTSFEYDVSSVKITAGDYNEKQLNEAVDKDELTNAALKESMEVLHDRSRIMVFGAGIDHVMHIHAALTRIGEKATYVHSKMSAKNGDDRDANIRLFLDGKVRWIVNNGILTTGFDCPEVDGMVMLRPTTSAGLHVQILGRGTRPVYAPGYDLETEEGRLRAIAAGPKPHGCRVLDFAGNLMRLGPINDPKVPGRKKKGDGDAPIKICPECGEYNHASARVCTDCGHEFPIATKLEAKASTAEAMAGKHKDTPPPEMHWFRVDRVEYQEFKRPFVPLAMKVLYYCGFQRFTELVAIEADGYAAKRARDFWRDCYPDGGNPPQYTQDVIKASHHMRVPNWIFVHVNTKFPNVMRRCFEQEHPPVFTGDDGGKYG